MERGPQIDNAPFPVFNYTLEGEGGDPPLLLWCTAVLIHPCHTEICSVLVKGGKHTPAQEKPCWWYHRRLQLCSDEQTSG